MKDNRLALVQQHDEWNYPHHPDCAIGLMGALANLYSPQLIHYDDLDRYIFQTSFATCIGSVEFMRKVFENLEVKEPKLPSVSLNTYSKVSLRDALEDAKSRKIFIKPVQTKLFSGLILDGAQYSCLNNIDLDTEVYVFSVFKHKIVTEWRAYIYKNEVVDYRFYSGDFGIMPNINFAKEIAKGNKDYKFPIAYTIDVAQLEDGSLKMVEFNDFWAIGNYGVPPDLYFRMLRDRYLEIVGG